MTIELWINAVICIMLILTTVLSWLTVRKLR